MQERRQKKQITGEREEGKDRSSEGGGREIKGKMKEKNSQEREGI